jgi:hypothetical protein
MTVRADLIRDVISEGGEMLDPKNAASLRIEAGRLIQDSEVSLPPS